ncbi:hypothetical protein [Pontiella agarivorans]|uniref:PhnA protein N-terminal proteobacterial domain-containing protein n=1 Tax=Pontiella agarivorans TaxID=3038953 RepID=A0ABU5MSL8_9BACT|nr:hypothetical protein [Pontiella agarivorans]MDZ8117188.1 hypothetical protein [Pontiella agarivorans]
MSTGFKGKFYRQNMLARYAKDLVRRSRSHCELCGKSGVKLEVHEVPPLDEEPSVEGCVFICEGCHRQVDDPRKIVPSHWRCLNNSLYSEVPAVQVIAFRMLRHVAGMGEHWAEELMEYAYLDPEVEEWANAAE